ncbi:MAG: thymidine phosphorylase [Myxococcota bacterium]
MASRRRARTFLVPELIAKKRDGQPLSEEEIAFLVTGFTAGAVMAEQMAAFAMAVLFRGMSPRETAALTLAMRDSGTVIRHRGLRQRAVDKHSTGGVGDKISLCLAPLVAACGVAVPMVSGRGLGHTGGTLDKLEAIPGFRTDGSVAAFRDQVRELGCALFGQTAEIAPADKRFYALRDVTGTVESIPLITASILSKKLAEGLDGLVLDVKVGSGAFMKTREDARALATSLVRTGRKAGVAVSALLTDMDAPLGHAIGNANETREAFAVLHGEGPADVRELMLALGVEMLRLGGERSRAQARRRLEAALSDGRALAKMEAIVAAQGGDPRVVGEPDRLAVAPKGVVVPAPRRGFVRRIESKELGLVAVAMGAGRTRSDQAVDPAVGITVHAKPGDAVAEGSALATLHVRSRRNTAALRDRVAGAFSIGARRPAPRPLVLEAIRR